MKPRKSKRPGYTPSFPALRDELIPPSPLPVASVTGDAAPGSFLPGIALAAVNDKPPVDSSRGVKNFAAYYDSEVWKRRAGRRLALANFQCAVDGCPRRATEVHHLNYDRWGKGEERDSDLSPLCKPHHDRADARREAQEEIKAAAAYVAAGFDRAMRVRHGDDYYEQLGREGVAEAREEWDDRQRDREGDDYE